MRDYDIPWPKRTFPVKTKRVSIADARDILISENRLFENSLAQLRTVTLKYPSGIIASTVIVIAQELEDQPSWGAALPASTEFEGRKGLGNLERFDISHLDRAWVDGECGVELESGTRLQAVKVVPARVCRELTPIQRRILYWTLKLIEAENVCYMDGPLSEDLAWLDYSTLYRFKVPNLNVVAHYVGEQDRSLRNLSHQTIADALSACGMRRPRSGRRAVKDEPDTVVPQSN